MRKEFIDFKQNRQFMKHILFNSFTIIIVFFLWGCKQKETKTEPKTDNWMFISWQTGTQVFTIINGMDSIRLETRNYKYTPSKTNGLFKDATLISTEIEFVRISKPERDSIMTWTKKLIFEPVWPKVFLTEYVGHLNLTITVSNQISQSCSYTSIGDWDKLSRETTEMKKLLCKKFQKVK